MEQRLKLKQKIKIEYRLQLKQKIQMEQRLKLKQKNQMELRLKLKQINSKYITELKIKFSITIPKLKRNLRQK